MTSKKQMPDRKTSDLQEECTYLTRLIQQYKLSYNRGRPAMLNNQRHSSSVHWVNRNSTSAVTSKYKKVNVKEKSQSALASRELKCLNKSTGGNEKETQVQPPLNSGSQNTASVACRKVYFNPHFSKINSDLKTSERTNTEKSEILNLKPSSVHVNPKVLAQILKSNVEETKPTEESINAVVHKISSNDGNEGQLQIKKLISESKMIPAASSIASKKMFSKCNITSASTNVTTKKYLIHSKTKLVKRNSISQQMSTNKVVPTTQKKLSPVLKSSLSWPLLSLSRTKLVRAKPRRPSIQKSQSLASVPNMLPKRSKVVRRQSFSRSRKTSLRDSTMAVKAAKAVCSKYKLSRISTPRRAVGNSQHGSVTNKIARESRYKIDRRSCKLPKRLKNVQKYSLRYEVPKRGTYRGTNKVFSKYKKSKYHFTNLKLRHTSWTHPLYPRRVVIRNKKLLRIGSSSNPRNDTQRVNNQQRSLVRIGGVLYKTSKLKLTRSVVPRNKIQVCKNTSSARKSKKSSSFVVYVRGNKFLMDTSGKTLLRVSEGPVKSAVKSKVAPLKRIDIGGVTFVQKSTNVLIRTNTHNARNLLSQAKQKSIAMLTNKLRKSNQSCIFYHRFGKCVRKEKGTCPHVHDPKHVAICKKFLQGNCEARDCLLSHEVGPEKMPTCRYFLEGCCIRDTCPYLHVKVNARASICRSFLRGYCADGKKCRKRHTYLCPDFEKTGRCPKGKYCPYPHKTGVRKKSKINSHVTNINKELEIARTDERKRYYETEEKPVKDCIETENVAEHNDGSDLDAKRLKLLKKVDHMKRCWLNSECYSDAPSTYELPKTHSEPGVKRPKIGILPAYIPLGK